MSKCLTEKDMEEVNSWLLDLNIKTNSIKIHREFSDAVLAATLIKKLHPKLIDEHNYSHNNGVKQKLGNWETLNTKALTKMGLPQTKMMLEKLAKGTPGAIETLLGEIMEHDKANHAKDKKEDGQEKIWTDNDEIMMVTVNKKVGDAIVQVAQKMILFSSYEKIVQESISKDNVLTAAHQRIAHLENLISLKTERIEELCNQLARVTNIQRVQSKTIDVFQKTAYCVNNYSQSSLISNNVISSLTTIGTHDTQWDNNIITNNNNISNNNNNVNNNYDDSLTQSEPN